MDPYADAAPLWQIPHTSSFSQLAEDDFLTLLQKQFPNNNAAFRGPFADGVDPQNISRFSLPSITPPSEDSSPSPPNLNNDSVGFDDNGDAVLKRKASEEDIEGGPIQKSQHTLSTKKATANRKKSTGAIPKDETRLLKRKEQNRAAQRAFRERKEKHVKDLEDKVAALEAKNEQANHENDNLRDLLARLQTENIALKQASFTFTVPKSGPENGQASTSFASQAPEFASSSRSPTSPSVTSTDSAKSIHPTDWSSLTTFDPAMLSLLDDGPQSTATDDARQMDFGFGTRAGLTPNTSYTTIASNPIFMSYASAFDSAAPVHNVSNPNNGFFDLNSLTWSPPPPQHQDTSSLDDLFAGYMTRGPDYPFMTGPSSVASESPVNHHANLSNLIANAPAQSPASSSTPSSSNSDPLFDTRDGSTSESDSSQGCPMTKREMAKRIEASGLSPFAPIGPSNVRKSDSALGPMISCSGTTLPKTQKNDQNIEVLSAWRSITSNPKFKDVDIDRLCTEFTSKAKCDGTKVVLEPQGVDSIIKNLSTSVA